MTKKPPLYFIDLFAGCGGLSLGLMKAGWRGLFAIEVAADAYGSLKHNLIEINPNHKHGCNFDWPEWLDRKPYDIRDFLKKYRPYLKKLHGTVQLVAGGPPCQGFSFAGKRDESDPRNELFKYYLEVVDLISPEFVLMENVQGINVVHGVSKDHRKDIHKRNRDSYAARIRTRLEYHGFVVQQQLLKAMDFGVPQIRPRYITVGIRRNFIGENSTPFFYEILSETRKSFLDQLGLPINRPISAYEAISDLATLGKELITCTDPESTPGYREIKYTRPSSRYQTIMHENMNSNSINSLRLINHRPETVLKFKKILKTCKKGVQLSGLDRKRLGIAKLAITPLAPDKPAHTLTTLPDDLLHYSEPRVHTVREFARLQSFPDWFEFHGKYSTGGSRRSHECPRYSQVGNAVPPLLAQALGETLLKIQKKLITENIPVIETKYTANSLIKEGHAHGARKQNK